MFFICFQWVAKWCFVSAGGKVTKGAIWEGGAAVCRTSNSRQRYHVRNVKLSRKQRKQWADYRDLLKGSLNMTIIIPLTQKAQGILAVQDGCHSLSLSGPGEPLMVIPGNREAYRLKDIKWPMFARPCPFRPRHGFVDSIRVYSWVKVIELLQDAKTEEPLHPVEIVLAPVLSGKVSAVATNAGVTWGRGNDGVTAGTDPHTIFIPVKTSQKAWFSAVLSMVGVDWAFEVPACPYLEIVENYDNMCLVQVRDGPAQTEGANHVVQEMTVRHVLRACLGIDLLDWERQVHLLAKIKGAVIWAPDMSLASHFCVHGIESGIPIITDHEVKIGDMLLPTKNRTSIPGKSDYVKIASLLTQTMKDNLKLPTLDLQKDAILTAIATTQAQFCWGKEPHLLRLRGLSVAILLKAVLASCAGEIRHWTTADGPQDGDPLLGQILNIPPHRGYKTTIYRHVFNSNFTFVALERALNAAVTDLNHPDWNRSFGGSRWAKVAKTGIKLAQMAKIFCDVPCQAHWSKVVQSANRLINTSHNNGKCLTKWFDSAAMTMISLSPTVGFLNPYVTRVALEMLHEEEELP